MSSGETNKIANEDLPKYKTHYLEMLKNIFKVYGRKLLNRIPKQMRSQHYSASLHKYDRRAGSYVEHYRDSFDETVMDDVVIKGQRKYGSMAEAYHGHLRWLAREVILPLGVVDSSILEVGAGELTTLVPLLKHISVPSLKGHASELSWSRCSAGKAFAESEGISIESLATGSVTMLPYPNNSIDIVYTHYCLEELSGYQHVAIQELMRVAKRYVILVEASYELGLPAQRRKLRNRWWNLGLKRIIEKQGLSLVRHELTPYCTDALHHGALFLIAKKEEASVSSNDAKFSFACPACKQPVKSDGRFYSCKKCSLAFPVLEDIPVFTIGNAIFASRYTNRAHDDQG